jgi:hypothetical protein
LPGKGSHLTTRCLGNFTVKGGYKDFDLFSAATVEPVIAEAEITGPIILDDSCRLKENYNNSEFHTKIQSTTVFFRN